MIKLVHTNGNEITLIDLAEDRVKETLITSEQRVFVNIFNKCPTHVMGVYTSMVDQKINSYVKQGYKQLGVSRPKK